MSNFIDELEARISECQVVKYNPNNTADAKNVNIDEVNTALEMLNSLGENAERMIEIGIIQDSLVKIGFEFTPMLDYGLDVISICNMIKDSVYVSIYRDLIIIADKSGEYGYYYDSRTWQKDLLDKVRELIGVNHEL